MRSVSSVPVSSLMRSLSWWNESFALMTNSASRSWGLLSWSAVLTMACFIFARSWMLSQTASQLPAQSLTFAAMLLSISLSPLMRSSVGWSWSVMESYLRSSTKPPSVIGSSSQCFLISVTLVTLRTRWMPSALRKGLATMMMSVALKLVLGTPKSLTTLSKTPYGESPWMVPATMFASAPTRMAS